MSKKPQSVSSQLADRIDANRRGLSVTDELANQLLAEYLADDSPSYRQLGDRHGMPACTVMRAIKRAAAEADGQ